MEFYNLYNFALLKSEWRSRGGLDGLEKATVLDKSSWCTSSQHCFLTFFPVSSSSQCCLSQLPHQILHTNIGRARRQKSIPTILTETVGAQGVQPQENVTTFLNLFWVPITPSWPPKEKKNTSIRPCATKSAPAGPW